jgi:hypothetical protein
MSEHDDKYNSFMILMLVALTPFAIGIWMFLGLMKLIY